MEEWGEVVPAQAQRDSCVLYAGYARGRREKGGESFESQYCDTTLRRSVLKRVLTPVIVCFFGFYVCLSLLLSPSSRLLPSLFPSVLSKLQLSIPFSLSRPMIHRSDMELSMEKLEDG